MICQKCSAELPEGQVFCGKCGYKTTGDSLASLSERLATIEAQLGSASQSKASQQNYLELETAEKVVARVQRLAGRFLWAAGVPLAILALALAVTFGKGTFDLQSIAAHAKDSVNGVVDQARLEATKAATTANDALATSTEVNTQIHETQRRVEELNTQVASRSTEVQNLNSQIKASQTRVEALAATVSSQTQQIAHLSQQVNTVETQKDVATISDAYPSLFGEHRAVSRDGFIDPKAKKAGEVYLVLSIFNNAGRNPTKLTAAQVAAVQQSLRDNQYRVFLQYVSLISVAPDASSGAAGGFDQNSCDTPGGSDGPPCIVYFNEKLRAKAAEVKTLVTPAQIIPDNRIRYVPPAGMTASDQELLQISGVDIVVVLGQR